MCNYGSHYKKLLQSSPIGTSVRLRLARQRMTQGLPHFPETAQSDWMRTALRASGNCADWTLLVPRSPSASTRRAFCHVRWRRLAVSQSVWRNRLAAIFGEITVPGNERYRQLQGQRGPHLGRMPLKPNRIRDSQLRPSPAEYAKPMSGW